MSKIVTAFNFCRKFAFSFGYLFANNVCRSSSAWRAVDGLNGTKEPGIKAWEFCDRFSGVNVGNGHVDRI